MKIPEWGWYVGAGVNVDKIETIITQKRAALQKRVKNYYVKIIAILATVLLLILLSAKFISNHMKKSFDLFSAFSPMWLQDQLKLTQKNYLSWNLNPLHSQQTV